MLTLRPAEPHDVVKEQLSRAHHDLVITLKPIEADPFCRSGGRWGHVAAGHMRTLRQCIPIRRETLQSWMTAPDLAALRRDFIRELEHLDTLEAYVDEVAPRVRTAQLFEQRRDGNTDDLAELQALLRDECARLKSISTSGSHSDWFANSQRLELFTEELNSLKPREVKA